MALKEIKDDCQHYYVDEKGLTQGVYLHFLDNGGIKVRANYLDGKLHGEYIDYHDDTGNVWEHANYWHGALHGECKIFRSDGSLRAHCYYFDSDAHGEYKEFSWNGALETHRIYNHGIILNIDPKYITNKEKFALTLRYGIQWL